MRRTEPLRLATCPHCPVRALVTQTDRSNLNRHTRNHKRRQTRR